MTELKPTQTDGTRKKLSAQKAGVLHCDQFVLPESFDPREFLSGRLAKRFDDARYVVDLIYVRTALGLVDDRGAVPLQAQYLRNVMAKDDSVAVIRALAKEQVVIRDFYIPREKCYGYRLGDRFKNDGHVRIAIRNPRLVRALKRLRERFHEQQLSRMQEVHHHLKRLQYGLAIDVDHAYEILKSIPTANNLFGSQGFLIAEIARRQMHFSVGKYGRVSNSITNLSRPVRAALTHKGEPLHYVDISCCQPALLGQMVSVSSRRFKKGRRQQEGEDRKGIIYDAEKRPSDRWFAPEPRDPSEDLRRYCELTQQGEFYEFLESDVRGMTRAKIKQRFLTDVIAKRKANKRGHEYPSQLEDRFKEIFPTVYQFIRMTNCDGWEHKNLIRELQRAESNLVIGQVSEGLRQRHPEMFFLTLHDAIYSTEGNMPAIVSEFERAFEINGFSMRLKPGY